MPLMILIITELPQLFINYGQHFEISTRVERQTWCRGYHFTCHCKACELDWSVIDAKELSIISYVKSCVITIIV